MNSMDKQFLKKIIRCECGVEITCGSRYKHRKTIKHERKMNSIRCFGKDLVEMWDKEEEEIKKKDEEEYNRKNLLK